MNFEDISSIVSRTVNLHPEHKEIQFHAFDIVEHNAQVFRTLKLRSMLKVLEMEHTIPVGFSVAENLDDVMKSYDKILSLGYEGIVVRHTGAPYVRKRSTYVMKFKPKKDDYYTIIGYQQMLDKDKNPKEMLGALVLKTWDEDTIFSVGSGMDDEFRTKWWPSEKANELKGKICHIKFQHLTEKKVPRFPVFVEIIDPTQPIA
jgi:ATP-dependent DNA ligase